MFNKDLVLTKQLKCLSHFNINMNININIQHEHKPDHLKKQKQKQKQENKIQRDLLEKAIDRHRHTQTHPNAPHFLITLFFAYLSKEERSFWMRTPSFLAKTTSKRLYR